MEEFRAANGYDSIAYGVNVDDSGRLPSRAERGEANMGSVPRCWMPG